jgi:hypothetical protein
MKRRLNTCKIMIYIPVNSWASIAQSDSNLLEAGKSRDRILVEARFSTPVQTGPVGHPASHTMGTGSFPGVKRPGRGVDQHPHPPVARFRKE